MADFDIRGMPQGEVLALDFTGASTSQNADAMTRRYFNIVLASGMKKVLVDIRALKGRLSDGQTFFLLRELPVKPTPPDIQTAIVESQENRAYGDFLETTAVNAGVPLRCFFDRAEALAWLAGAGGKTETA